MAELLAIEHLSAGYGRAVVLSDVAFRLGEGEALAVLGRNGVGKTTLIDSLIGVTRRFSGSIAFTWSVIISGVLPLPNLRMNSRA